MTVGENIRRIRKERGLTIKQLGDMVGVSESYIRAYESGRRNPKESSLKRLAEALNVNEEVLIGSDFDGVRAMHRIFQLLRMYGGKVFEVQDEEDGGDRIAISFNSLPLMTSLLTRYEQYEEDVAAANEIRNVSERAKALLAAEESFDLWMDMYPETEPFPELLKIQKGIDNKMDFYGTNPKDPD